MKNKWIIGIILLYYVPLVVMAYGLVAKDETTEKSTDTLTFHIEKSTNTLTSIY